MDFTSEYWAWTDAAVPELPPSTTSTWGPTLRTPPFAWDDGLEAIVLTFNITAVPEPSSTALLGLGGLALIAAPQAQLMSDE